MAWGDFMRGSGGKFTGSKGGGGSGGSGRAAKLAALKARVKAARSAVADMRSKRLGGAVLAGIIAKSGGVSSGGGYLRNGMRDLTHARSLYQGKSKAAAQATATSLAHPIRVHVERGKGGQRTVILNDGRHRMTAAREAGATHIRARVIEYGPRGGKLREWTGPVKI